MRYIGFSMCALATTGVIGAAAAQPCPPVWEEVFGARLDSTVRSMAVFDDGSGAHLYVGGQFNTAGGALFDHIAKWDGQSWSDVGGGIGAGGPEGPVAMTVFNDGSGPALYVGGSFTVVGGVPINYIAKWDGQSWSDVGGGANGNVGALTIFDDGRGPALYASGAFRNIGGQAADRIARWDGQSWEPLGAGAGGTVGALAVFDDGSGPALYVGGGFSQAGGVPANRIARWDGQSWSGVGGGMSTGLLDGVLALHTFDDGSGPALFAGGLFASAGGVSARNIAKWDGQSWSDVGGGTATGGFYAVTDFETFDDGSGPALYAAGTFPFMGGVSGTGNIARWDGAEWSDLEGGIPGSPATGVGALAVFTDAGGDALYAGGQFSVAGGTLAEQIARWGCLLPPPCYPDCDGSGILDFFDFLCFQNSFLAGDPYADCDGSTTLDFFDFLCFQNEFLAGCP